MPTYPATNGKPKFNEFQTPIGLISRLFHDVPEMKTDFNTKAPVLDKDGVQEAHYKVSMVWPKSMLDAVTSPDPRYPGPGLVPMRQLAGQTANEAWPERLDPAKAAWIVLQPFLLDGDNPEHNTERKEYLFGHVWLNIKSRAQYRKTPDGKIIYSGAPGLLGPYGPGNDIAAHEIWPGCTGRVSGIMYGTEFAGKKFVSVRLNNIQKYQEGERIGGGSRPDAASQFDPLMAPPAGAITGTVGGGLPGGLL